MATAFLSYPATSRLLASTQELIMSAHIVEFPERPEDVIEARTGIPLIDAATAPARREDASCAISA